MINSVVYAIILAQLALDCSDWLFILVELVLVRVSVGCCLRVLVVVCIAFECELIVYLLLVGVGLFNCCLVLRWILVCLVGLFGGGVMLLRDSFALCWVWWGSAGCVCFWVVLIYCLFGCVCL